ncbi:MAG: chromate transporter [Lachnospiraceae bacterium]|nr:chromate transporter [Lachnospiraceae bacterium]
MIYLELFLGFLYVGCFAFGGAYGAIPLIRDVVLKYGWLAEEELTYMIAVSESTPGPIMINLATYVGSTQAGILGSLIATTAVVIPSFVIMLLITAVLKHAIKHPAVQAVLQGMKPCIIGIILATGLYMMVSHCFTADGIDIRAILITAVLAIIMYVLPKFKIKKPSPILLIIISACIGVVVYGV